MSQEEPRCMRTIGTHAYMLPGFCELLEPFPGLMSMKTIDSTKAFGMFYGVYLVAPFPCYESQEGYGRRSCEAKRSAAVPSRTPILDSHNSVYNRVNMAYMHPQTRSAASLASFSAPRQILSRSRCMIVQIRKAGFLLCKFTRTSSDRQRAQWGRMDRVTSFCAQP